MYPDFFNKQGGVNKRPWVVFLAKKKIISIELERYGKFEFVYLERSGFSLYQRLVILRSQVSEGVSCPSFKI